MLNFEIKDAKITKWSAFLDATIIQERTPLLQQCIDLT